ncbi:PBECR2 nuclease fold domain-containing protein [Bdellovibrio sp. HCB185ZH]|uniref:PBECR2 nuclease fold domain-containing protein n=1 Tax=Bdellovibrio sp. HCB185ZH TaxID=3394235 RepID=UPI0039A4DCAC
MAKAKTRPVKAKSITEKEYIVVDEKAGLIFETEQDLYGYFETMIKKFQDEYQSYRTPDDFSDEDQMSRENYLESTLDDPDEVWMDNSASEDYAVYYFIREFEEGATAFKYIAIGYMAEEEEYPTFVFMHFPTRDSHVWHHYQKQEMVYDRGYAEASEGAIEGDAMLEGDPLAVGLYQAMMKVRTDKDISQDKFQEYADLREETIESADEIWRKTDTEGHVLVSFIKEFPDHETKDLVYVAVTQEDEETNVHSLLFSFPTNDEALVDRYRQGENLQAEEVSQESSH